MSPGESVERLLTHVPAISGLVLGTIVAVSVAFDWSYFLVLGGGYFSILTVGDHVSTGVTTVPVVVILGAMAFLWYKAGLYPYVVGKYRHRAYVQGAIIVWSSSVIAAVAIYLVLGALNPYLPAAVFGFIWFFAIYCADLSRLPGLMRASFVYFVALVAGGLMMGWWLGLSELKHRAGDDVIRTTDGNTIAGTRILKFLEKGVIVRRAADGAVQFFPWPQVASISRPIRRSGAASPN
jgi:hypothetical protein